jgi:heptosyltransferase-2
MKILLVQTSFLGDTILSTPVIEGIKRISPSAELWMMTTPLASSLVIRDPLLTGVFTFDKRNADSGLGGLLGMGRRIRTMGFDKVYSLHRSFRTSLLLWLSGIPIRIGFTNAKLNFCYHETRERKAADHEVLRNLSLLSGEVSIGSLDAEIRLFAPERNELHSTLDKVLPQPADYVVLVPGSEWRTKMWHWEGYREVVRFLLKQGFAVILLGAASDKAVNAKVANGLEVLDLAGTTSISDAMYIIKHARLVVCNDSMALHMASAFKIPNVAIFCATSPHFGFHPWKNRAIVVEKDDLPCKPCCRHGGRRCPTGTEACMTELSHDRVIGAARDLLGI